MLKRYAAEKDCDVKGRMMMIIRVQRDGITIRDSAKSLEIMRNLSKPHTAIATHQSSCKV